MSMKSLFPSQALNKLSDAYHKVAEVHPELVYYAKIATVISAGIGAGAAAVKYFSSLQHRKVARIEMTFPDGTYVRAVVAEETLHLRSLGDRQWDALPLQDRSTRSRNAGLLE